MKTSIIMSGILSVDRMVLFPEKNNLPPLRNSTNVDFDFLNHFLRHLTAFFNHLYIFQYYATIF